VASREHYPGLKHMLAAYFHEDWDTEGDDWPDLVRNYLRDTSAKQAAATADEIDRLRAEGGSEERALREFGCCYDAHPEVDGPGFRAWLIQVADMLRADFRLGAATTDW
jgi:hypothetical protein